MTINKYFPITQIINANSDRYSTEAQEILLREAIRDALKYGVDAEKILKEETIKDVIE